jgi:hypothetical protein
MSSLTPCRVMNDKIERQHLIRAPQINLQCIYTWSLPSVRDKPCTQGGLSLSDVVLRLMKNAWRWLFLKSLDCPTSRSLSDLL